MSAKGLPPAVRLDPLPLPLGCKHPQYTHLQHTHDPVPFRFNSPDASSQVQAQAPSRGLTPIIITPESSRSHTPTTKNGTPLLVPASTLPTTARQVKKHEPVELEPIVPKSECRAMGVAMDVEEDADPDTTAKSPPPPQLPTPHTTPITQTLDVSSSSKGDGGQYRSPRPGQPITLHLDHNDGLPSLSKLADVAERERLEDEERGRTRERGRNSRFRDDKERYKPYDPASRPLPTTAMHPNRHTSSNAHQLPPPPQPTNAHQLPPPPSPPLASNAIHTAADDLIHLFNTELHHHIQTERDSLHLEREKLKYERKEMQRQKDLTKREREDWRHERDALMTWITNLERDSKGMRELKDENERLRAHVEQLEAALRRG